MEKKEKKLKCSFDDCRGILSFIYYRYREIRATANVPRRNKNKNDAKRDDKENEMKRCAEAKNRFPTTQFFFVS